MGYECVVCAEKTCEHVDELIRDLTEERDRLAERQEEHLRLIRRLSNESIDEKEAEDLRSQMAALIAEVGTLRSRVNTLERVD